MEGQKIHKVGVRKCVRFCKRTKLSFFIISLCLNANMVRIYYFKKNFCGLENMLYRYTNATLIFKLIRYNPIWIII